MFQCFTLLSLQVVQMHCNLESNEEGTKTHLSLFLKMDDKLHRQLSCDILPTDTSKDLASELVHYAFINEEDSEKVAGFLENAIKQHRVRALASGSTQWGGVPTGSGPDGGSRGIDHSDGERARGQRVGRDSRGPEEAQGADPMGNKKKGQTQMDAAPWQTVNHPSEKEWKMPAVRVKPKAPLVGGPEESRLRPATPQSRGRLTNSLPERAIMP